MIRHGREHTPEQAADHDDLERDPSFRRGCLVFFLLAAALVTWSTVEPVIRQPGFIAYCEHGHTPSLWQAGPPAWATGPRMDLLCAVGAWARAEFAITEWED